MKKVLAILKNQKGASQIAVYGGILLFSLLVVGAAAATLHPQFLDIIRDLGIRIQTTFTTIAGL